jgi:predicted DNA binding CopG/RHH family protein
MRTTMTINDTLYLELKRRALESGLPVSSYVEDALKYQLLEDAEDLEAVKARVSEPTYSFDELVKEFKQEGLL